MKLVFVLVVVMMPAACVSPSTPTASPDASSSTPVSTASGPRVQASCSGRFPADAELQSAGEEALIAIDDFFARAPTSGRFTVEGYLQAPNHCVCGDASSCSGCEETVFLSTAWGAFKGSVSDNPDLRIKVPDARRFEMLKRYRMTFEVCAGTHVRELRGYHAL